MKPIINFIFSSGHRCYSVDFLIKFKLRKMSGPFDWVIIDLETSLKIINNKFDNFLNDLVYCNKNLHKAELCYKKNTNKVDNKLYNLLENNIGYMVSDLNSHDLHINQNYLDDTKLNNNIYNWNTVCLFLHHNLLDNNIYNYKKKSCERFINIMNKYNETTALLHVTRINNNINIVDYMNSIIEQKKKYSIDCFLIMIITCVNIEDNSYFNEVEKCLFIIKKVENYKTQYLKYKDNENNVHNISYEKEFNVISNYFDIKLIEKNDI
jgi:hypothetical protein